MNQHNPPSGVLTRKYVGIFKSMFAKSTIKVPQYGHLGLSIGAPQCGQFIFGSNILVSFFPPDFFGVLRHEAPERCRHRLALRLARRLKSVIFVALNLDGQRSEVRSMIFGYVGFLVKFSRRFFRHFFHFLRGNCRPRSACFLCADFVDDFLCRALDVPEQALQLLAVFPIRP